jgi:hypothetical protein
MTKYTGGDTVKAGFYWNRGAWGVELIPAEGGTLPGDGAITYVRVPWPALLIIAPVMGGAFAMFLPFIGIALLVQFGWRALTGRLGLRHGEART